MDETEQTNDSYRNMSAEEQEIYRPFLLCRDGYKCNICKTSIQLLIEESQRKEESTGTTRQLPVVLVEHKNNDSWERDSIDPISGQIIYCGNLQLSCYPCNRKKNPHKIKATQAYGRDPSREKLDNLRFEPTYHRNLHNYLVDSEQVCLIALKKAGKKLSEGGNKVTVWRYFESEEVSEVNRFGSYRIFAWKCKEDYCNGTHVCLRIQKPLKLIKYEIDILQSKYDKEYNNGNREEFMNNRINFESFMTFAEYYNKYSILANQFNQDLDEITSVSIKTHHDFQSNNRLIR